MKILITGASGFVGGNLATVLSEYATVYGSYLKTLPDPGVAECAELIRCDLEDAGAVADLLAASNPDCIVHCAALSQPAKCESAPSKAQRVNVEVTRTICETASQLHRQPLLLFCSTDLVFDGVSAPAGGHRENSSPSPATVYAKTKLAAEQVVRQYPGAFSILRLCLVYGPPVGAAGGFLSWMRARLEASELCDLFADEWRTPVAVSDIAAAVMACMQRLTRAEALPPLVHLAGATRLSRYEFGQKLCTFAGYDQSLLLPISQHDFAGPPRTPDATLNSDLLTELLGRPPLSVEEGLAACKILR